MTTIREQSKARTLTRYKLIHAEYSSGMPVKELANKHHLSREGIYFAINTILRLHKNTKV